jgi:hypothetical protein
MATWCDEPLRMELAEIMDDLDPGWARWRDAAEPAPAELA